jgi:hypothetical protein
MRWPAAVPKVLVTNNAERLRHCTARRSSGSASAYSLRTAPTKRARCSRKPSRRSPCLPFHCIACDHQEDRLLQTAAILAAALELPTFTCPQLRRRARARRSPRALLRVPAGRSRLIT